MIRNTELVILIQTLVAAEQGSFHKAGALLGIPASTVSRRVRALEAQIGVKLFNRHRHGIRRTTAGDGFLEQIRRILDELNIVLANASTVGRGKAIWLKIGLYVSPGRGHLRAALREFKRTFPQVEIQYTDGERRYLMERLNAGAIDVAIVADHFRQGVHDVIPLWQEKVLVAMPESHRLANKQDLTWEDLRKEQIFLGRDPGPELKNRLVAKLKASGDVPLVHQHNVGSDFTLSLVGIESDLTLLYEADSGARHPGVIYREVSDSKGPSLVPYYACWLSGNDNPALHSFLDLLRQYRGGHSRYR
jgi:DNA-binding transcriptional LysR family regulator